MRIKVTAAVISKDTKILVAQKGGTCPLAGKWEFPGGKIEDGETPEMCLKKELEEELGISVDVNEFLATPQKLDQDLK
jgi:mutator protein MutT